MKKFKYIILGAGPSGLSFAHTLKKMGESSFLVIEKENRAGGLCRSEQVDNSPLDIGGGHFLDVKLKNVTELLFSFLPEKEWTLFNRVSTISYKTNEIDYPFESNIWQLPIDQQIDFIESIAKAGCSQGITEPSHFEEWITWKLGDLIAQEYMLPYNRKIWGDNLNTLGTYWLYKLPNVSLRDTIRSVIEQKLVGTLPAHAKFYYPTNFGYGEVWDRMGKALGNNLLLNTEIHNVDPESRIINNQFEAENIINTIPWTKWGKFSNIPDSIISLISELYYSSIQIDYYPTSLNGNSHWIYIPDENIPEHRILCRNNFSTNSKGYWTESNVVWKKKQQTWSFINEFAYPLNTINKPDSIRKVLEWSSSKNIFGLGRWGEWEHMNSDIAVDKGIKLSEKLYIQNNIPE